ncbi:MAG: type III-B CRISPR module-associated protein Cmr5 [Candidatus Latescibacterota bacterium]|nr:MAG: type III-B CRISPR module-associated protein Cmr5 [Candidatus Latescibacterota bacterium]
MIYRNLDHDRALYAYKCVEKIEGGGDETEKKKYRSAVLASGALIHKSGLMQTLAFYLSKKDKEYYKQLAGHILHWDYVYGGAELPLNTYHKLLNLSDEEVMYRTQEAKALILWLKRFAEAMLEKGEE